MKNQVIVVEQKPIIRYELLTKISQDVKVRIESLNLDTLEVNESTLTSVKNTRSELNKNFKELEEQRKLVKEIVLADYNKFEDEYKKLISMPFKEADEFLKSSITKVDDKILQKKIDKLKAHFVGVNKFDFIAFEDVFNGEKIIKSTTDKAYECKIGEYLDKVKNDLKTISTGRNEERVLAKYQIYKDLNRAISEVNIEIDREDKIKEQQRLRGEQKKLEKDEEKQRIIDDGDPFSEVIDSSNNNSNLTEEQTFKAIFTVTGTREQIAIIREFMKMKGINYEPK